MKRLLQKIFYSLLLSATRRSNASERSCRNVQHDSSNNYQLVLNRKDTDFQNW
ncbi:hypothetical protein [Epilithonimonas sp.]|uniref:hypothetical protein n=1 Tax=Epilithonimonas sp. TaxID=2894511 RepID=UPI002FDCC37E